MIVWCDREKFRSALGRYNRRVIVEYIFAIATYG